MSAEARKSVLLPILLTCIGYACYNLSDAGTKFLVTHMHFSQVMATCGCLIIIFMSIYGWLKEGKKAFRTNKPKLLLLRAVLANANSIINLLVFPHLHLTTFYTLAFTSPFWVALLSMAFMKDKADPRRLGVIVFGLGVILYIFRPGTESFNIWSLLMLLNALLYSCQLLVVRQIGAGESRSFMFTWGSVIGVIIGLTFMGDHYVAPTQTDWMLFIGCTLAAGIGLLCISKAFQEASSASAVAPYHYTQIVWGALLGYAIFDEVPNTETMIGAGLIIAAGLYLIRHETRKSLLKPEGA